MNKKEIISLLTYTKMFIEDDDVVKCMHNIINQMKKDYINQIERWKSLLLISGINSKMMVVNDIDHILKELKNE